MHRDTCSPTRYRLISAGQHLVHQHSSPERQRRQREQGFTLIEMIIVLAVIGILAAIAIPQFSGILSGAQATAMAGELASASASNVAICRQRGLSHPRCVNTSTLADSSVSGFATEAVDPKDTGTDNDTAANIWTALYAIHIGGADVDSNGDVTADAVTSGLPGWVRSSDGTFTDELTLGCQAGGNLRNWANMRCAIAEGRGFSGNWPWDDTTTDPDVIETFQINHINAN